MMKRVSPDGVWVLVPALLALVLAGCRQEPVHRARVPKEASPAMPAMGGGLPENHPPMGGSAPAGMEGPVASPDPSMAGGITWTLPKGWTETRTGGMRVATLVPTAPGVDVSVTVLSGPAGGELANVNRWRGQISLGPVGEADLPGLRKPLKSAAGSVSLYDFAGGTERMLVGLLVTPDGNTWFVKAKGQPGAIQKIQADFKTLLESLRRG